MLLITKCETRDFSYVLQVYKIILINVQAVPWYIIQKNEKDHGWLKRSARW